MTALPLKPKRFTPAEYYALERQATYKSDYYNGEIFDMSGGTSNHSLITANLNIAVGRRLPIDGPCVLYDSNMRLLIVESGLRTYPDASVCCQPLIYDTEDPATTTATNPTVVFEVLSSSTEGYDRGMKAENYRKIPTLKSYVLLTQSEPYAESLNRQPDGTWSTPIHAKGLDAQLPIGSIGVTLPLAEVYRRVSFAVG